MSDYEKAFSSWRAFDTPVSTPAAQTLAVDYDAAKRERKSEKTKQRDEQREAALLDALIAGKDLEDSDFVLLRNETSSMSLTTHELQGSGDRDDEDEESKSSYSEWSDMATPEVPAVSHGQRTPGAGSESYVVPTDTVAQMSTAVFTGNLSMMFDAGDAIAAEIALGATIGRVPDLAMEESTMQLRRSGNQVSDRGEASGNEALKSLLGAHGGKAETDTVLEQAGVPWVAASLAISPEKTRKDNMKDAASEQTLFVRPALRAALTKGNEQGDWQLHRGEQTSILFASLFVFGADAPFPTAAVVAYWGSLGISPVKSRMTLQLLLEDKKITLLQKRSPAAESQQSSNSNNNNNEGDLPASGRKLVGDDEVDQESQFRVVPWVQQTAIETVLPPGMHLPTQPIGERPPVVEEGSAVFNFEPTTTPDGTNDIDNAEIEGPPLGGVRQGTAASRPSVGVASRHSLFPAHITDVRTIDILHYPDGRLTRRDYRSQQAEVDELRLLLDGTEHDDLLKAGLVDGSNVMMLLTTAQHESCQLYWDTAVAGKEMLLPVNLRRRGSRDRREDDNDDENITLGEEALRRQAFEKKRREEEQARQAAELERLEHEKNNSPEGLAGGDVDLMLQLEKLQGDIEASSWQKVKESAKSKDGQMTEILVPEEGPSPGSKKGRKGGKKGKKKRRGSVTKSRPKSGGKRGSRRKLKGGDKTPSDKTSSRGGSEAGDLEKDSDSDDDDGDEKKGTASGDEGTMVHDHHREHHDEEEKQPRDEPVRTFLDEERGHLEQIGSQAFDDPQAPGEEENDAIDYDNPLSDIIGSGFDDPSSSLFAVKAAVKILAWIKRRRAKKWIAVKSSNPVFSIDTLEEVMPLLQCVTGCDVSRDLPLFTSRLTLARRRRQPLPQAAAANVFRVMNDSLVVAYLRMFPEFEDIVSNSHHATKPSVSPTDIPLHHGPLDGYYYAHFLQRVEWCNALDEADGTPFAAPLAFLVAQQLAAGVYPASFYTAALPIPVDSDIVDRLLNLENFLPIVLPAVGVRRDQLSVEPAAAMLDDFQSKSGRKAGMSITHRTGAGGAQRLVVTRHKSNSLIPSAMQPKRGRRHSAQGGVRHGKRGSVINTTIIDSGSGVYKEKAAATLDPVEQLRLLQGNNVAVLRALKHLEEGEHGTAEADSRPVAGDPGRKVLTFQPTAPAAEPTTTAAPRRVKVQVNDATPSTIPRDTSLQDEQQQASDGQPQPLVPSKPCVDPPHRTTEAGKSVNEDPLTAPDGQGMPNSHPELHEWDLSSLHTPHTHRFHLIVDNTIHHYPGHSELFRDVVDGLPAYTDSPKALNKFVFASNVLRKCHRHESLWKDCVIPALTEILSHRTPDWRHRDLRLLRGVIAITDPSATAAELPSVVLELVLLLTGHPVTDIRLASCQFLQLCTQVHDCYNTVISLMTSLLQRSETDERFRFDFFVILTHMPLSFPYVPHVYTIDSFSDEYNVVTKAQKKCFERIHLLYGKADSRLAIAVCRGLLDRFRHRRTEGPLPSSFNCVDAIEQLLRETYEDASLTDKEQIMRCLASLPHPDKYCCVSIDDVDRVIKLYSAEPWPYQFKMALLIFLKRLVAVHTTRLLQMDAGAISPVEAQTADEDEQTTSKRQAAIAIIDTVRAFCSSPDALGTEGGLTSSYECVVELAVRALQVFPVDNFDTLRKYYQERRLYGALLDLVEDLCVDTHHKYFSHRVISCCSRQFLEDGLGSDHSVDRLATVLVAAMEAERLSVGGNAPISQWDPRLVAVLKQSFEWVGTRRPASLRRLARLRVFHEFFVYLCTAVQAPSRTSLTLYLRVLDESMLTGTELMRLVDVVGAMPPAVAVGLLDLLPLPYPNVSLSLLQDMLRHVDGMLAHNNAALATMLKLRSDDVFAGGSGAQLAVGNVASCRVMTWMRYIRRAVGGSQPKLGIKHVFADRPHPLAAEVVRFAFSGQLVAPVEEEDEEVVKLTERSVQAANQDQYFFDSNAKKVMNRKVKAPGDDDGPREMHTFDGLLRLELLALLPTNAAAYTTNQLCQLVVAVNEALIADADDDYDLLCAARVVATLEGSVAGRYVVGDDGVIQSGDCTYGHHDTKDASMKVSGGRSNSLEGDVTADVTASPPTDTNDDHQDGATKSGGSSKGTIPPLLRELLRSMTQCGPLVSQLSTVISKALSNDEIAAMYDVCPRALQYAGPHFCFKLVEHCSHHVDSVRHAARSLVTEYITRLLQDAKQIVVEYKRRTDSTAAASSETGGIFAFPAALSLPVAHCFFAEISRVVLQYQHTAADILIALFRTIPRELLAVESLVGAAASDTRQFFMNAVKDGRVEALCDAAATVQYWSGGPQVSKGKGAGSESAPTPGDFQAFADVPDKSTGPDTAPVSPATTPKGLEFLTCVSGELRLLVQGICDDLSPLVDPAVKVAARELLVGLKLVSGKS